MTDHAITTLNAALVEQVLQGTLKSEEYLKRVSADPASALVEIGYQMNFPSLRDLTRFSETVSSG